MQLRAGDFVAQVCKRDCPGQLSRYPWAAKGIAQVYEGSSPGSAKEIPLCEGNRSGIRGR